MSFHIRGLDPASFAHLHGLSDTALAARGASRVDVMTQHSAPCRVSLDDVEPETQVILLNYLHQPADTPYRQQGPIFVSKAAAPFDEVDAIPPALERRPLSLRAFDADHMMVAADLIEGSHAQSLIKSMLGDGRVAYIQAHYARRGCFAANIHRA